MKKLISLFVIVLALLFIGGCSAANEGAGDNNEQTGGEIDVKARYVGTEDKGDKHQVVIQLVNADFKTFKKLDVELTVEGLDKQGEEKTESLVAVCKELAPGQMKKVKVQPKQIIESKKVTIESVAVGK